MQCGTSVQTNGQASSYANVSSRLRECGRPLISGPARVGCLALTCFTTVVNTVVPGESAMRPSLNEFANAAIS